MVIPRTPAVAVGDPTPMEDDVVGIMTNGVLLDSHKQTWAYDSCNGHSDKKHQYHYHIPPICFMESMGIAFADTSEWWINDEGNATRDYDDMAAQFPESGPPSPVIGFARDGFPIFGPYDDQGMLMRGAVFSNDTGLDACNGKEDSAGSYGYYMTVDPPFAPPCLRGTVGVFAYYTTQLMCPKEGIENMILTTSDPGSVSRGGGDGRALRGFAVAANEVFLRSIN
jgi:YHYH protein